MRCAGAAAGAGAAAHLLLLALLLLIALQLFNEFLCHPHRHLYAFHLRHLFRLGPFTVSDPKCRTALDEAHGSCYLSVSVSSVRLQSSCYQSIGNYRYQAFAFKPKLLSIDSVSSRLTSKLLLSIDLAGIRTFEKECEPEDLDPNSYSDDSENEIAGLMTRSNFTCTHSYLGSIRSCSRPSL